MLLSSTVERIIANGGGVSIDGSKYLASTLERFASFAAQSGATLIIRNCNGLLSSTMERIAAFGRGRVIFHLDD